MATIIISDLQPIETKTFLYDLNSAQIQNILATGIFPLANVILPLATGIFPFRSPSGLQLNTLYDGMNNTSTSSEGPFGFHDNKIFTLDFSKTAIYFLL
jgi:hypothetical protein